MPADTPAPEAAAASTRSRTRTVAAGTRAPRATAAVPQEAAPKAAAATKKKAPAKAAKTDKAKATISNMNDRTRAWWAMVLIFGGALASGRIGVSDLGIVVDLPVLPLAATPMVERCGP